MNISQNNLRYIGAALYWGEGTKIRYPKRGGIVYSVEFTNIDPLMILVFLRFLREIICADEKRIRAQIFIYPDNDLETEIKFWSEITRIPIIQFQAPIQLKQSSGRYRPSLHGIMKIRYAHKEHFLKIQGIIDEIKGGVG